MITAVISTLLSVSSITASPVTSTSPDAGEVRLELFLLEQCPEVIHVLGLSPKDLPMQNKAWSPPSAAEVDKGLRRLTAAQYRTPERIGYQRDPATFLAYSNQLGRLALSQGQRLQVQMLISKAETKVVAQYAAVTNAVAAAGVSNYPNAPSQELLQHTALSSKQAQKLYSFAIGVARRLNSSSERLLGARQRHVWNLMKGHNISLTRRCVGKWHFFVSPPSIKNGGRYRI